MLWFQAPLLKKDAKVSWGHSQMTSHKFDAVLNKSCAKKIISFKLTNCLNNHDILNMGGCGYDWVFVSVCVCVGVGGCGWAFESPSHYQTP